jgi:outer membrane lipoprotein carrier protein
LHAILASASDLKALSADFDLQPAPEQDGLQWVQASPKDRNGQLKSVRVGFAADGQLSALDILDSFGQRSLIRFSKLQTQASLPASTFEFKVPAGADVLKQ